jgi:hypothetical protein
MALRILQPGIQPLGQFDGLDTQLNLIQGGEVGTIIGIAVNSGDKAAADADGSDGYVGVPPNQQRPVVTLTLAAGARPLFLLDEGTSPYYGTLFGRLVGGTAGQIINGTILGPNTDQGSGKVTLWDKPGLYATTLDAVDTDPVDGLAPTNVGLSIGDPLYATAAGLLTPDLAKSFDGALVVARFVEFSTDGSLVTTPEYLVAPTTGPGAQPQTFSRAIYHFIPPGG